MNIFHTKLSLILFILPLVFFFFYSSSSASQAKPFASSPSNGSSTVYDLLPEYGLPPGLVPDTVKSFIVDDSGNFEIELYGTCYVDFEYLVYYQKKITGVLKYGGIQDLKGIQARRFLIWFDVDGIKVDLPPSEYIYFQVGWITRRLMVQQFQTVHSCRDNSLGRRVREALNWMI